MSIITKYDMKRYIPKEHQRIKKKYGQAIYIPQHNGNGIVEIFSKIVKGVSDNKENIKAITDSVSNLADASSKVANLGINIAKGVEEIKHIKKLREKNIKSGEAFFKLK